MTDWMKRFDRDGDGKLDDAERAAAKEILMKEQPTATSVDATSERPGPEAMRTRLLEMFDQNKDGRLDDYEVATAMKAVEERGGRMRDELVKRFDRNGNGQLDDDERMAAQKFLKERTASVRSTSVSAASVRETRGTGDKELENVLRAAIAGNAAQLQRFDADKDGKLSDQEWAAARKQIQSWANDGTPQASAKSPAEELKRLQAVAAEVERRRKKREEAMPPK